MAGNNALSFAVGVYLPLSTTFPIFIGGAVRGLVEWKSKKKGVEVKEEDELGSGNLFATGLVAGGALAGVLVAVLSVNENVANTIASISAEHGLTGILGEGGFQMLGVLFFVSLAIILYKVAIKNNQPQL